MRFLHLPCVEHWPPAWIRNPVQGCLSLSHAPQADRITSRNHAPLCRRHARLPREPNSIKCDEIAARQLHALKQHHPGKLRLSDVKEMFE